MKKSSVGVLSDGCIISLIALFCLGFQYYKVSLLYQALVNIVHNAKLFSEPRVESVD